MRVLVCGNRVKYRNIKKMVDNALKEIDGTIMISIGGDGTFLHAAKKAAKNKTPLLCLRSKEGNKGVLAEGDISEINNIIKKLKSKKYSLLRYPLLEARVKRKKITGFNEIGFFRTSEKALRFDVYINSLLFYKNVIADGGIISTPIGSTAYNISAGGPILDRSSRDLVFAPLNPHSFNKPVVFSGNIMIKFERHPARIFADGSKTTIMSGNKIEINESRNYVDIISLRRPFYNRWQRIVNPC